MRRTASSSLSGRTLELLDGDVEVAMLETQPGQALLEGDSHGIADARVGEFGVVHGIVAHLHLEMCVSAGQYRLRRLL